MYDITMMSDTRLLATVNTAKKVMLVDSQAGRTVDQISLKNYPRGVCIWDNNTAAVTLMKNKVQLININDNSLTLGNFLNANGDVWGIARSNDRLVVSYSSPPWLKTLSIEGKVINRYDYKKPGGNVFEKPNFIATNTDGMVFVSDLGKSTITQLDCNLLVTSTYPDPILQRSRGIISFSADHVLVCIQGDHRILKLCTSTGAISSLLQEEDGIEDPYALTYSSSQRKLYVVPYGRSGRIQIFQQQ